MQLAMPDTGSAPLHVIVTGLVYQPAPLGPRAGVPALTCGGVASYSKANVLDVEFPALSWQLPEAEAVASSGPE